MRRTCDVIRSSRINNRRRRITTREGLRINTLCAKDTHELNQKTNLNQPDLNGTKLARLEPNQTWFERTGQPRTIEQKYFKPMDNAETLNACNRCRTEATNEATVLQRCNNSKLGHNEKTNGSEWPPQKKEQPTLQMRTCYQRDIAEGRMCHFDWR